RDGHVTGVQSVLFRSKVPVDETWDVPLGPLVEAVSDPSVGVVWLCNPNNPTGRLLGPDVLHAVLEAAKDAVVVVDEAYAEISGQSLAPVVLAAPNGVLV